MRGALFEQHTLARPIAAYLINLKPFTLTMDWVTVGFEAAFFLLVFSPLEQRSTRRICPHAPWGR